MTIRSTDHETIAGLKPGQRAVLDQIWRTFTSTGFDDGKLRALQVQRMSGAEVRAVFAELRQLGWVQAVIKAWGSGCITSLSTGWSSLRRFTAGWRIVRI